ncbi:MAG: phosphomannomutase/phosphoglucomutase [Candidatus Pacebacteria bacterium]|nr:phosphomannomutase/phosphoglucomutase [Candidatus Paceibacterota bacterium]MDD5357323.1 phosphomannomutase/phosphoglucomutase [Candidatus Paceibacterota bacterium]
MEIKDSIFKAYDIRGIYPTELNEEIVYAIGQAFAEIEKPKTVVVGRDVRISGPSMQKALIQGLLDSGVDVVDIGLISTEEIYFATAYYKYDAGISVTASHNPREYTGMKMVRKGAEPIAGEEITVQLKDKTKELLGKKASAKKKGKISTKDVHEDFRKFVLGFIDVKKIKPFKVVANPNFGFQGELVKLVCRDLPITWSFLNGEPDGNFPKGRPDPFLLENRTEFIEKIKKEKPDFGVTWDADADRVFFATGNGIFLEAHYTNVFLIEEMLRKNPKATIVYEPRCIWALLDIIKECGGIPVRCRVGHSFIKKAMRASNAVFCGELTGHTYFKDFFFADSGIIPFLLMIEFLSQDGKSLEECIIPIISKYPISGEINLTLKDAKNALSFIQKNYANKGEVEEFDNLIVEKKGEWRFNIRMSNTEPLLRINIEAKNKVIVEERRSELLALLKDL